MARTRKAAKTEAPEKHPMDPSFRRANREYMQKQMQSIDCYGNGGMARMVGESRNPPKDLCGQLRDLWLEGYDDAESLKWSA